MTTKDKIIIVLLTLIIIIAITWLVMDYQKTERQYQACLDKCLAGACTLRGFGSVAYEGDPTECSICAASCREKYGK